MASYGLPPYPTGPGATATAIASWTQAVRSAQVRRCTERPVFDPQTGSPVAAAYDDHQAGNVDRNGGNYSWVSANWHVPSVAGSNWNVASNAWVGMGDFGAELVQGGSESDMNFVGFQSYYAWTQNWPYQKTEQQTFGIRSGDLMYSDVWTPNCVTIQDDSSNPVQYTTSCVGTSATTADVDFIVERPGAAGGGFYGLAKFGTVTISSTSDSQTDPDGDTHYGINMTTTGGSGGTACASPGSWVNEAFTVTWQSYC